MGTVSGFSGKNPSRHRTTVSQIIDRQTDSELPSDTFMHSYLTNSSKRKGCRVALAVVLALTACSAILHAYQMHRSERHESRREIDLLEEAWRNAALKANTVVMDGLLADDYMAITSSGTLQTKEQSLTNLRTGRTRFASIGFSERKVRFYGTTALVTSVAVVSGSTPEGELSGSYRYTRVYVRDEHGKWKIVSFEANRIRSQDERK